jgi:hypothetical protein
MTNKIKYLNLHISIKQFICIKLALSIIIVNVALWGQFSISYQNQQTFPLVWVYNKSLLSHHNLSTCTHVHPFFTHSCISPNTFSTYSSFSCTKLPYFNTLNKISLFHPAFSFIKLPLPTHALFYTILYSLWSYVKIP